jgi:hypothetical protein
MMIALKISLFGSIDSPRKVLELIELADSDEEEEGE